MKILFILLVNLLSCLPSWGSVKNLEQLSLVPVIHEGRIKPLDSYSKLKLNEYYGKSTIEGLTSMQWLGELLFDPAKAYRREVFKIVNRDVRSSLGLNADRKNFSFIELYTAFGKNRPLLEQILSVEEDYLDLTNKQVKELYLRFTDYMGISRSFSLLFKDLKASDGQMYSYLDLLLYPDLQAGPQKDAFKEMAQDDAQFVNFTVIPKKLASSDIEWVTPWNEAIANETTILKYWNGLYQSYLSNQQNEFDHYAQNLQQEELNAKFKAETILNKVHFIQWAVALYVLSFLFLCLNFLTKKPLIKEIASLCLLTGAIVHTGLIVMRCYILSRAPVTNLYESILFVALTTVVVALFYEYKKQNELGLFLGSVLGASLLFLSYGYEKSGDNLSMIVAVLDTNFWLATHVVTISIGYGCALVASAMSHFYLFKFSASAPAETETLKKNIHSTLLFALFFTTLGTILGGIWADQSWGRFWGWDPKENGALLICLWLLWIAHGKISRHFKDLSYAFFTALTSVIVVIAWFGVNLLNVGLHSYGFSNDAAANLAMFSVSEVLFTLILYLKAKGFFMFQRKA